MERSRKLRAKKKNRGEKNNVLLVIKYLYFIEFLKNIVRQRNIFTNINLERQNNVWRESLLND